jgi:hypothetical protein
MRYASNKNSSSFDNFMTTSQPYVNRNAGKGFACKLSTSVQYHPCTEISQAVSYGTLDSPFKMDRGAIA